jgi:DNA-binding NtrC family response regulator
MPMGGDVNVLVVDDDVEFLEYARDRLRGRVKTAATAVEAMWWLEREPIDVLLCDVVFRDVDGRDLVHVVKERWPELGCVLVTGFSEPLPRQVPEMTLIVFKPCDFNALNQLVADLAGVRPGR